MFFLEIRDLPPLLENALVGYEQSWAVFKYIVFKYIYCIYTLYLNTFEVYLNTCI